MTNNEIQEFLVEIVITKPMLEYSECVKRLIHNPNDRDAKARIIEIESFFLSKPFRALTHANGTEIIEAIQEMLDKHGVHIRGSIDEKAQNHVH